MGEGGKSMTDLLFNLYVKRENRKESDRSPGGGLCGYRTKRLIWRKK